MAGRQDPVKLLDALLVGQVNFNLAQWCREYGVPYRTAVRHAKRIREEGEYRVRSRRPHTSPHACPEDLRAWIRKLRADLFPDNGADYIRDELLRVAVRTRPHWAVPARSTINRVLGQEGLLVACPARRPRSACRRFSYVRPGDCYQIDATTVALADGTNVVAFEVIDDCTRTMVASHTAPAETALAAVEALTKAVRAYGAPAIVLSDNGTAFTSRRVNRQGRSKFEETARRLGIHVIHSSPYHPQTCGKVERLHQTTKKWLRALPRQPRTLRELQRHLDRYQHHYNTQRRHSALPGRSTPQHAWDTALSYGGPSHLPTQDDATVHKLRVAENGRIIVGAFRISIGRRHAGATITAIRNHNHVTIYTPDGNPIGTATLKDGTNSARFQPTQ